MNRMVRTERLADLEAGDTIHTDDGGLEHVEHSFTSPSGKYTTVRLSSGSFITGKADETVTVYEPPEVVLKLTRVQAIRLFEFLDGVLVDYSGPGGKFDNGDPVVDEVFVKLREALAP